MTAKTKAPKLTLKQQLFVEEFIKELNATKAALAAGYSPKTASHTGYENLKKPQLWAAIQQAFQDRIERTQSDADRVLEELKKLAYSEMVQFAEWDDTGITLRSSGDLTPGQSACVAELGETVNQAGGSMKFKLHSKTHALELLGKHYGLFPLRHTGPDGKEPIQHDHRIEPQPREEWMKDHEPNVERTLARLVGKGKIVIPIANGHANDNGAPQNGAS